MRESNNMAKQRDVSRNRKACVCVLGYQWLVACTMYYVHVLCFSPFLVLHVFMFYLFNLFPYFVTIFSYFVI
jgi:hypothetical protein